MLFWSKRIASFDRSYDTGSSLLIKTFKSEKNCESKIIAALLFRDRCIRSICGHFVAGVIMHGGHYLSTLYASRVIEQSLVINWYILLSGGLTVLSN